MSHQCIMVKRQRSGFTLIELLVVVAIIALLIGILLPSLATARNQARTATCGTNLRAVGQGLFTYETEQGRFPFSYAYKGEDAAHGVFLGMATNGYIHWSALVYNNGLQEASGDNSGQGNAAAAARIPKKAFTCPSLPNGGLPPTNPNVNPATGGKPGNLEAGQTPETSGVVDIQVERVAYALNEAIAPRNKWPGFSNPTPTRPYRCVRLSEIEGPGTTVLATELTGNWRVVTAGGNEGDTSAGIIKSHRPLTGFRGRGGESDLYLVPAPTNAFRGSGFSDPQLQHVTTGDLSTTEPTGATSVRLNWVGRNHGSGSYASRTSNFLYADGHVENKSILKTINKGSWEWGKQVYTLMPGNDVVQP